MIDASALAEQIPPPTKHDFTCRACGRWTAAGPGQWCRAKCANRQCRLFGQQQTMYAGRLTVTPLCTNDS